ncbi:MAG: HpcH/HpaI aldolase family protein [Paracoccaceae bacterium]
MSRPHHALKSRLADRQPLLGAFLKTPAPILVEVLGQAGLDFLVIDAEHGPFGRAQIDTLMIAGRAAGLPLIVRVPARGPDWIGYVLDAGAAGIMVPHVNSAEEARAVVRAVRYGAATGGHSHRGFAGTTRGADYAARSMADLLGAPERETVVMAQIEEPAGVAAAPEIAAVDGIDTLFVGRADLAVSSGRPDFFGPDVRADTEAVLAATGCATGLYCAPGEDRAPFRTAGASVFVVGSEHTLMVGAARALRERFDAEA